MANITNGTVTVQVSGGVGPYQYTLLNADNNQPVPPNAYPTFTNPVIAVSNAFTFGNANDLTGNSGLQAGSYRVKIVDANQCETLSNTLIVSNETPAPTATPTPMPTATPVPTATEVPPTATPEPTIEPTATEVPPTATPEPTIEPTATEVPPTATPEPTATATPEPTATPHITPTPVPPTATPEPTATEVPPTATPEPTATPAPLVLQPQRKVISGWNINAGEPNEFINGLLNKTEQEHREFFCNAPYIGSVSHQSGDEVRPYVLWTDQDDALTMPEVGNVFYADQQGTQYFENSGFLWWNSGSPTSEETNYYWVTIGSDGVATSIEQWSECSIVPTATPEPTATEVPPTATPEPTATATPEPTATEVPPTATPEPTIEPTATATPEPTATEVPPTATPVPTIEPTATEVPPTATPVPPTATPEPTATEVPPTATPEPTATEVPPTATPVPPTATPVPPTATPEPTATEVPPTATPVPPTATPEPTATATPVPATQYFVNVESGAGDSDNSQQCEAVTIPVWSPDFNTLYDAAFGDTLFTDANLTTPFDGGAQWYDLGSTSGLVGGLKILVRTGAITTTADCPAPEPTATPVPEPTATPVPEPTATPRPTDAPADDAHFFHLGAGSHPYALDLINADALYMTDNSPSESTPLFADIFADMLSNDEVYNNIGTVDLNGENPSWTYETSEAPNYYWLVVPASLEIPDLTQNAALEIDGAPADVAADRLEFTYNGKPYTLYRLNAIQDTGNRTVVYSL